MTAKMPVSILRERSTEVGAETGIRERLPLTVELRDRETAQHHDAAAVHHLLAHVFEHPTEAGGRE